MDHQPIINSARRGEELYFKLYQDQTRESKQKINAAVNDYFDGYEQFDRNYPKIWRDFTHYTYDFNEHVVKLWSNPENAKERVCPSTDIIVAANLDQLIWRCSQVVNNLFAEQNDQEAVKEYFVHHLLNGYSLNNRCNDSAQINELKENAHRFFRATQDRNLSHVTPSPERGRSAVTELQQSQGSVERIEAAINEYIHGWTEFNKVPAKSTEYVYHRQKHEWQPNPTREIINDNYHYCDRDAAMWLHHNWLMNNVLNTLFPDITTKSDVNEYLYQTQFKKNRKELFEEWRRKNTKFCDVSKDFLQMLLSLKSGFSTAPSSSVASSPPPSAQKPVVPASEASSSSPAAPVAKPSAEKPAEPPKDPSPQAKDEKPFALWRFFAWIGNGIASACSWLWCKMPWVKKAAS